MTLEEIELNEVFEGNKVNKADLANAKRAIAKFLQFRDIVKSYNAKEVGSLAIRFPTISITSLNSKLTIRKVFSLPTITYSYAQKLLPEANSELDVGLTEPYSTVDGDEFYIGIRNTKIILSNPNTSNIMDLFKEVIEEIVAAGELISLIPLDYPTGLRLSSAKDIKKAIVQVFNSSAPDTTSYWRNISPDLDNFKKMAAYLDTEVLIKNDPNDPWKLGKVTCVLESKLRRLGIVKIRHNSTYSSYNETFVGLITALNTNPMYNIIDPGRQIFAKRDLSPYSSQGNVIDQITFMDSITSAYTMPSRKFLEELRIAFSRTVPQQLITDADIKNMLAEHLRKNRTEELKKEKLSNAAQAISNSLDSVAKDNTDNFTIINGMKVYKDRIVYENEVFKSTSINPIALFKQYVKASMLDINFDTIFNSLITSIVERNTVATIGTVEVEHEIRRTKTAGLHYINGTKISNNDLSQVIRQALCFETTEEYNKFVKRVGECSLKITSILNEGLEFAIWTTVARQYIVNLKVERYKNKQYLVLDEDNKFQISNTNSLIRKAGMSIKDLIDLLCDPKVTSITDRKVALDLLIKGKQRQEDAIKRSIELLKNTEKVLKLAKTNEVINGKSITGYKIVGLSGKIYFVDSADKSVGSHGGHYPVYELPSGKALCIVDKASSMSQVGKDALVNRLFALKNDQLVAKHISTLGL